MGKRKDYSIQDARIPKLTENLRILIDKSGGVSSFANKTGFTSAAVNHWYNGGRTPDAKALLKIGKETGASIDYLLGLTDASTTDYDERFICEYTGLDLDAVQRISCDEFTRTFINSVISSQEYDNFIHEYESFRGWCAFANYGLKEITTQPIDADGEVQGHDTYSMYIKLEDCYDSLRLSRYEAVEAFKNLICDRHRYKSAEAKAKEEYYNAHDAYTRENADKARAEIEALIKEHPEYLDELQKGDCGDGNSDT